MNDSSQPSQAVQAEVAVDFSDPRSYRHWCRDIIRFADLDAGGHVNNTAFATFFETGRVNFFADARGRGRAAHEPVLAVRLTFELRSELFYPGEVDTAMLDTDHQRLQPGEAEMVMQPEDIAAAVVFAARTHPRALVADVYMQPSRHRNR